MTKRKNTKKALILSCLSLLLCVSMLVGSTFAWFTDNATTKVNTIQAGTLGIKLTDSNGDSVEGKTLGFVKEDGTTIANSDIKWEPGARFILQPVNLVSTGNLWLEYKVVISGYKSTPAATGEDLAEVIDVIVEGVKVGTLKDLAGMDAVKEGNLEPFGSVSFKEGNGIVLQMQTSAGNAYQGLSVSDLAVTVYAKQFTKETDSFDDQYDAGATYGEADKWDGTVGTLSEDLVIDDAAEFAAFAAAVNAGDDFAGKTVTLNTSIDLDGLTWTSIKDFAGTFDGQGYTISNLEDASLFAKVSATGTVKNLNLQDASSDTPIGNFGFLAGTVEGNLKNCTVKDVTLTVINEGTSRPGNNAGLAGQTTPTAVIEDCHVNSFTVYKDICDGSGDNTAGFIGTVNGSTIRNCSVSNIDITSIWNTKRWGGFIGSVFGDTTLIENCTANNVKITTDYAQNVGGFIGYFGGNSGAVKNCRVDGAEISIAADNKFVGNAGKTGGFISQTGKFQIEGCHVTGLKITTDATEASGIGGFSGGISYNEASIKNCSAEGEIDVTEELVAAGVVAELYVVGSDITAATLEGNTVNVTIK